MFHELTQKELAEKLGISTSHLSEIESGKKTPTLTVLDHYAQVFEVPVSSIFFLAENLECGIAPAKSQSFVSSKIIAMLDFIAERSVNANTTRTMKSTTQYDRNQVPYTEENLYNFLEAKTDDISYGARPDITLSIRKYPKRYVVAFEVVWDDPEELWPQDAEEAAATCIESQVYLWPERYDHSEFDQHKEQILNNVKSELQKRYMS